MISITMDAFYPLPSPFDRLPAAAISERELLQDEILFHEGDVAQKIFFLQHGSIHLVRHTEAGQKVTMFRASAGDTMAEPALFSDNYHCNAVAQCTCKVTFIDKHAVLDVLKQDAEFAAALVQRLSGQVQAYRRHFELLAIRSAKDRVMAGLADGRLTGSVMEFSNDVGLSHEAVYRALSELVREDQVEHMSRGVYRIKCDRLLPP